MAHATRCAVHGELSRLLGERAETPTEISSRADDTALDMTSATPQWLRNVKTAGFGALSLLIVLAVLQPEASQALQRVTDPLEQREMHFHKPFFLMCAFHSASALLLPIVAAYYKLFGSTQDQQTRWRDAASIVTHHCELPPGQLWKNGAILSVLFGFTDYFWIGALTGASVAVSNALVSSGSLFVYAFSVCFLGERVTIAKVTGMLLSIGGVLLIFRYQSDPATRLDADAFKDVGLVAASMLLVAAALNAAYEVATKALVGNVQGATTLLTMTGLKGLLTLPIWLIGSLVLAALPTESSLYEPLGWPASGNAAILLVVSTALALFCDVLLPLSLCWLSPLETSVGLLFTIPVGGVFDTLVHGSHFSMVCIAGAVLVMLGFMVLDFLSPKAATSSSEEVAIDGKAV